jgi:hypothetical protein
MVRTGLVMCGTREGKSRSCVCVFGVVGPCFSKRLSRAVAFVGPRLVRVVQPWLWQKQHAHANRPSAFVNKMVGWLVPVAALGRQLLVTEYVPVVCVCLPCHCIRGK